MLIDSDVLVWHTRGRPSAQARLASITSWRISQVTYIELAQGCANKLELQRLKKGLLKRNTQIIPVNSSTSALAADLIDTFALSHGLQLADALIAAAAIELNVTLLTANRKHFIQIPQLNIEVFEVT